MSELLIAMQFDERIITRSAEGERRPPPTARPSVLCSSTTQTITSGCVSFKQSVHTIIHMTLYLLWYLLQ